MSREVEAMELSAELAEAAMAKCPNAVTAILTAAIIIVSVEKQMGTEETQNTLAEVLKAERQARLLFDLQTKYHEQDKTQNQ